SSASKLDPAQITRAGCPIQRAFARSAGCQSKILSPMKTLLASALLAVTATAALAADVHVRVDPNAPHANPGQENLTTFPTIQNALDHHPFATDGGRVFIEV